MKTLQFPSRAWFKRAAVCFWIACLLMASYVGLAQKAPALEEHTLTLDFDNASLGDILTQAFRQAKIPYRIEPELAEMLAYERRTIHVVHSSLDDVLFGLLAGNPQKAPFNDDLIFHHVKGHPYVIEGSRVSLDLKACSPQEALKTLFGEVGVSYMFPIKTLGAKPITLALKEVSFCRALTLLLQRMEHPESLRLRYVEGIFFVQRIGWKPEESFHRTKVQYRLTNVPCDAVCKALFTSYNTGYILLALPPQTLTVPEQQGNLDTMLCALSQAIARPEETLTYKVQGGNFILTLHSTELDGEF